MYQSLKFMPFAYLVPIESNDTTKHIYPLSIRLSQQDKSNVILQFGKAVLKPGKCYNIRINKDYLGFKNTA